MSQNAQDPAQIGEDDMGEAFGPLPVSKLEVSWYSCAPQFAMHRPDPDNSITPLHLLPY